MSPRLAVAAVPAALALAGCSMTPMAPQATLGNIQALRGGEFARMQVGAFTAAAGAPTAMDKSIVIRAAVQKAPNGSYARLLADTLSAELGGAGKLDPASRLVISGVVTQAHLDSAMPQARAHLAARIMLRRDGTAVFEKELQATSTWKSSVLGAVAIPDAFNHYNGLFPDLVGRLLADPDFKAAAKEP